MNKIKIGIITFHASHNCGSLLQAYGLQYTLRKLNYDNEIIDFSNDGSREMYSVIPPIHLLRRGIRGRIKHFCRAIKYYSLLKKQSSFYEAFKEKHLKMTAFTYTSNKELKNASFDYTHYITGSDQVWNICCPDADTAYYLDFVKSGKKIAYAVSTGATQIAEKASNPKIYKDLVNSFHAISVREQRAVTQFQDMTGRSDIELLVDPTLLLTQQEWEQCFDLETPIIKGNYIFYYAFHYNKKVNDIVMQISNSTGMPVYIIEAKAWGPDGCREQGLKLCSESGPIAFLNLIKHAKLVLTTSFHGTVFSTIFRKTFWFVESSMHNPYDDRAATLVGMLQLEDRLVDGKELLKYDIMKQPDYSKITHLITEQQKKSLEFIQKQLS